MVHQISMLSWAVRPDDTGECFVEPQSILGTNDVFPAFIIRMGSNNAAQPTVRHGFYGRIPVPLNYASAPVVRPIWTSTVTAGAVVFDFEYRAVGGDDLESLDQTGNQQSLTLTDTGPSAAWERMEPAGFALTAGNLLAGDSLNFAFFRDGVDAADTKAGAAVLYDLQLEYSDSL